MDQFVDVRWTSFTALLSKNEAAVRQGAFMKGASDPPGVIEL